MQMILPNRCRSSQNPTTSGKSALMHRSHHCSPGSMHTAGCICPHRECPWRKRGIQAFHAPQNDTYTRLNNFENTRHSSRLGSQSVDYIYSSHHRQIRLSVLVVRTHALRLISFLDSSLLQRRQLRRFMCCQVATRLFMLAFHSCTSPVSSLVCCHHTMELLKGLTLSGCLLPLRVGCHCAATSGALTAKELHGQTTSPKQ
jgi:hypothetical protein